MTLKEQKRRAEKKAKAEQGREKSLKTKVVDYSKMRMELINEHPKTWRYVPI